MAWYRLLIALPFAALPGVLFAQVDSRLLGIGREEAISITAGDSVEWLQEKRQYSARGKVVVQKGESTVKADVIQAGYTLVKGKPQVQTITATGNVRIADKTATATGSMAEYQAAKGYFVLRGPGVRLQTADFTITAGKALEFWPASKRALATGGAVVVRTADTSRLASETLEVFFSDKNGHYSLQKVKATGGVKVVSGDKKAAGAQGHYDAAAGKVVLQGGVTLQQGAGELRGDTAEMDTQKGISRLRGGTKGRVEGVLGPEAFQKK